MPYIHEHVDAEILLEYKGVTVYMLYKNMEFESGPYSFGYCLKEDEDETSFDVRELPSFKNKLAVTPDDDREFHRIVIRDALESGYFDNDLKAMDLKLPRLYKWPVTFDVGDLERWQIISVLNSYEEYVLKMQSFEKRYELFSVKDFYVSVFIPNLEEATK